jgi:hypothetical protein
MMHWRDFEEAHAKCVNAPGADGCQTILKMGGSRSGVLPDFLQLPESTVVANYDAVGNAVSYTIIDKQSGKPLLIMEPAELQAYRNAPLASRGQFLLAPQWSLDLGSAVVYAGIGDTQRAKENFGYVLGSPEYWLTVGAGAAGAVASRGVVARSAVGDVANSPSILATRGRVLSNIEDSQAARAASRFDIQSGFEIALFGDVSTARNGAVFFSGRTPGGLANADLAGSFANQTAKDILNFTPAGHQLGELNLYPRLALDSNGVVVPRYASETSRVFEIASQRYAEAASGTVFVFTNGAPQNSIFTRVELPTLRANPNVTDIRFMNGP